MFPSSVTTMPSSKTQHRNDDYLRPDASPIPAPIPITSKFEAVVSQEQWIDQNDDHLLEIYAMLQEVNKKTGRLVFDKETCDFHLFCEIAYTNSFKYRKKDIPNYET